MLIGIDARLFGTRHGGIGRYTEKLIKHLETIDSENQYVVFLQKNNFDEYEPRNPNFKKALANFRAYSFGEQLIFPFQLLPYNFDFVHFTHFSLPIFYPKKFIVTIHDLIISHYPSSRATTRNFLFYKIKLFFYQIVVKTAAKRAEKIIAVSEFTKNDIVRLLKIKPEKIFVTYEGVALPQAEPADAEVFLRSLGVKGDYLLYVGSAYPHKNLERLVSAFKIIAEKNPARQLILAGKDDYFYRRLRNFINRLGLAGKIILAGYCDDQKLVALYQNAKAYVYPSLIEGFGLPSLEAQSYGLPMVCANASCLPEVAGEGAIYFNPEDHADMAEKIILAFSDDDLRRKLISAGYENLKKYSWDKCAWQTLAVYQSVIDR